MKSVTHTSALFITCLAITRLSLGDVTREEIEDQQLTVVRMTVDPAAAPVPAFKYRLLPPVSERQPGNAVPFYHRALAEMRLVQPKLRDQFGDDYLGWWYVPPEDFPLEEARIIAQKFEPVVRDELMTASRREFADWGFEEELLRGDETYKFSLDDIQATRDISRMLSLRTRLAIAEGRYADAIESMQIGFQLARDVSTCKFIVCDLVAIANANVLESHLEELIAADKSPSLYWALTALPDPLVIGRDSLELELTIGSRMFPWLADVETAEHAHGEWRRLYTETLTKVLSELGNRPEFGPAGLRSVLPRDVFQHGVALAYALKTYPAAKEALVASGMDRDEVEAMPVAQVLCLQTSRAYHYLTDEVEKTWHVPYRESRRFENAAMSLMGDEFNTDEHVATLEPIPLARVLLPAVTAYRQAYEQLRRQTAALAVIEAIRLHAAETGKLPEKLADVRVVPVPDNPATSEPFEYYMQGDTAILLLPTGDGFHLGKRYEIKLRN